MNKKVWHPLVDFLEVDAGEESGVAEWIDSGETDLLTESLAYQLQGAFLKISKYRMRNLAMLHQKSRIPDASFQYNNLHHTWLNIYKMYHCSKEELNDALKLNRFFDDLYALPLTKQRKEDFVETYERFLKVVFELEETQGQTETVEKIEPEESIQVKQQVVKETAATLEATPLAEEKEETNLPSPKTFIEQLTVLQTSSIESVVHADVFTNFQHYMHVERPIQKQFIAALETAEASSEANLVMLCGSVGDGKSHLISYVQEAYPNLLNSETCFIHNDSTESYNFSEDELETLERVLAPFEAGAVDPKTTVIAINLGVLHNFYMKHEHTGKFEKVLRVIEKSEVFTTQQDYFHAENDHATLLNFAGVQPYELSVEGIHSSFFNDIIERVSRPSQENPFYRLWEQEWNSGERTAAHINYHLLQDEKMRDALVKVLVEAMVKRKLFLSTRALYNLLYDVLVPLDNKHAVQPEQLLPYLLFERPDRSDLLHALHELDPIKRRDERFDKRLSEYMLTSEPIKMIKQYLSDDESYLKLWESADYMEESYLKLFLRHYYLLNHDHLNERYHQFLKYLYHYYIGEGGVIGDFFDYLDQVIKSWIGSPIDGYLYVQPISKNEYSVAVPFKGQQDIGHLYGQFQNDETLNRFIPELTVGYEVEGTPILISLDFTLFELIIHVAEGLRPGQQDYNEAIQFMEFYKELIRHSDQTKDLIIVHRETNHIMRIKKPRFARGGKTYEVETVK